MSTDLSPWQLQEAASSERRDRLLVAFDRSAVAAEFPGCGSEVASALGALADEGARTVLELLPHDGTSWEDIYRVVVPDADWTSSTAPGFPHYSDYIRNGGSRDLDALILHSRFDSDSVLTMASQYRHLLRPRGKIVYHFGRNEDHYQAPPEAWRHFIVRHDRAVFGWRVGQLYVGWVKPETRRADKEW